MLISNLDLLATASGGVARLRELILTFAVQGKLVAQDPNDEPTSELLKKIRAEKDRLIVEGKFKRDKPLAEIAKEEKPFELPTGWEWVRLGDITNYGSPSKSGAIRPETWVLDMEDIEKSSGRLLQRLRFLERPALSDKNSFSKGDVLYGKLRPYLNKVLVADDDGVCTTEIIPFRCHGDYVPEYFRLTLSSPFFLDYVNVRSYGMKMPRLGTEDARNAVIPLPPLTEQSRIVTRVEELMRLCDAIEAKGKLEAAKHAQLVSTLLNTLTDSETPQELAESWQRIATHFDLLLDRPEAVDALEQVILQLAVRGLLVLQDPQDEPASELLNRIRAEKDRLIAAGQIKRDKPLPPISEDEQQFALPVGWKMVRMGDMIELISGQHLGPSEYVEGLDASIPYLTGPAEFGAISPVPSRSTHERRAVAVLADILITVKGSGVGKLNVVTQNEIAISRQLMAIRPVLMNAEFLMIVLQTMALHFQEKSVGIAIPGIGREDVTHAQIGLPPLPEQSRIVSRVTQLRRLCSDLRQRLTAARERQSQIAQALVEQQSTATI